MVPDECSLPTIERQLCFWQSCIVANLAGTWYLNLYHAVEGVLMSRTAEPALANRMFVGLLAEKHRCTRT